MPGPPHPLGRHALRATPRVLFPVFFRHFSAIFPDFSGKWNKKTKKSGKKEFGNRPPGDSAGLPAPRLARKCRPHSDKPKDSSEYLVFVVFPALSTFLIFHGFPGFHGFQDIKNVKIMQNSWISAPVVSPELSTLRLCRKSFTDTEK